MRSSSHHYFLEARINTYKNSDWFNEECTKAANVDVGRKDSRRPFREPQFLFRPHVHCDLQCKSAQTVSSAGFNPRAEGKHLQEVKSSVPAPGRAQVVATRPGFTSDSTSHGILPLASRLT